MPIQGQKKRTKLIDGWSFHFQLEKEILQIEANKKDDKTYFKNIFTYEKLPQKFKKIFQNLEQLQQALISSKYLKFQKGLLILTIKIGNIQKNYELTIIKQGKIKESQNTIDLQVKIAMLKEKLEFKQTKFEQLRAQLKEQRKKYKALEMKMNCFKAEQKKWLSHRCPACYCQFQRPFCRVYGKMVCDQECKNDVQKNIKWQSTVLDEIPLLK